ncbi:hypothetical protein T4E_1538 [Trichinella pseudospiralis]|uniref:Uncharacterized protein n=1 Tax=Trichinella pseudospiralis TaxID=6337 RepID=A0A0V0X1Z4_TRIPS|nr:hypothetical protein T4E_1538 [Trichinella pseudospiralis]
MLPKRSAAIKDEKVSPQSTFPYVYVKTMDHQWVATNTLRTTGLFDSAV